MTAPSPAVPRVILALSVALGAWALLETGRVAAFHCDETNVFRAMTEFAAGELGSPGRPGLLWLLLAPLIWLGEPTTIALAARGVAVLASLGTLLAVAGLASRAAPHDQRGESAWAAAAAAALLAGSASWQSHAFELRTDTFVPPLALAAAALLWRVQVGPRRVVVAGLLIAASGLISQKSVYNAAALGLGWGAFTLAAWRPSAWRASAAHARPAPGHGGPDRSGRPPWRTLARDAALLVGVVGLAFVAWFVTIGLLSGRGASVATQAIDVGVRTAFTGAHPLLRDKLAVLEAALHQAPVLWGLLTPAGLVALLLARRRPLLLATLAASSTLLATLLVHRGIRSYYVASFDPVFAVLVGAALAPLLAWLHRRHVVVPTLVLLALAATQVQVGRDHLRLARATSNVRQLALMRDLHEAFDEPVPYWDLLGLVPGHREITFLGTAPTRDLMRRNEGSSAFVRRVQARKPRAFLRTYMSRDTYLKPTERSWVWTHFVPYRPNLSLLGARARVTTDAPTHKTIEILVAGVYTVWFRGGWQGEAAVGERSVRHREEVVLAEGRLVLTARAQQGGGELQLLLGAGRIPDAERPEDEIDWSIFPRDERDRFQQYDRRGRDADLRTPPDDPSLTPAESARRAARHQRWQREHSKKYGS